jgi:hypothetical protein
MRNSELLAIKAGSACIYLCDLKSYGQPDLSVQYASSFVPGPLLKSLIPFSLSGSCHAVRNIELNKYSTEQRVEERILFSAWYPVEPNVANINKHTEDSA